MEFRILGPLEVVCDGRILPVGRRLERALLAALLLSANRVVSWDRLVEDLWGDASPPAAAGTLRVYVSRLRRALGEGGGKDVLVTRSPGYLLNVEDDALDASRFEALTSRARQFSGVGDHVRASEAFRQALGLWRGAALVDVGDAPFARAEAARLEEARLTAWEERIEADLACGLHRSVIGELEVLSRAHPLRERFSGLRMLALYRAGRHAEALRVYQELRCSLAEELGLEPEAALRQLERAILRQDPDLDLTDSDSAVFLSGSSSSPATASLATAGVMSTSPVSVGRWRFDEGGESEGSSDGPSGMLGRPTPFVGRGAERSDLGRLLDRAAHGTGALVLVGGEPGVGKTRLAEELALSAVRRGMRVFFGHAYEMTGAPAYLPFVEILEQAAARAPNPKALREELGEEAPEIARLLPRLRGLFPDIAAPLALPPEQERRYLFNSVRRVLARAALRCPLLLVLDDLHWADESTLLLVEHLAEGLADIPALVVGTYRDNELDVGRPLARTFEDLTRRHLAARMSLSRLSEFDVAQMLGRLTGQQPPPSLVEIIYKQTEGNPFFVEEVFEHLVEDGRLFDAEERFRDDLSAGDIEVPETVRLAIGRRLERLGRDTRRVLGAAAVVGRVFSFDLLEALGEIDLEVLLDALEASERARLIVPVPHSAGEDRFLFTHELIRQTLLSELSLPRRRRLHLRSAEAIEKLHAAELCGHAARISYHLLEAGPKADVRKTFVYLVLAGEEALAASAFEDALRYLERALLLADRAAPLERAELLFQVGLARRSAGDWDEAIDAWRQSVDAFEETGDEESAARVCSTAAYSLGWASRFTEGVEMCERGLAALGEGASASRARLLGSGGMCAGFAGFYRRGADMIDEEIALAGELGEDALLGHALFNKCLHRWTYLEHREAAEAGEEAAGRLDEAGDLFNRASVLGFAVLSLVMLGRLDDVRRLNEELGPLAERVGNHPALLQHHRAAAMAEFFETGDLEGLAAFGQADLNDCRRWGLPWVNMSWGWLGVAEFLRGNWEEALARFGEGERLEPPVGALKGWNTGPLLECLAYLGERTEALALLESDAPGLPRPGDPRGWGSSTVLFSAVEGLAILGERERAGALYPLVLDVIGRTGSVCGTLYDGRLLERVAGVAAMAGQRWEVAEAHFTTALEQAGSIPHRPEEAHTRRFAGQMLLERDNPQDRHRAVGILEAAFVSYRRMGMPRHAAMTESLLGQC
jgi:DNA-binding SARP family transcriptional activator